MGGVQLNRYKKAALAIARLFYNTRLRYSFKIKVIFNTTLYNVTLPLVISML